MKVTASYLSPAVLAARPGIRVMIGALGAAIAAMSAVASDCVITNPAPPAVPSVAAEYKPGATLNIAGNAGGANFRSFRVEWARGASPAGGWTNAGVSLVGNGAGPLTNSTLASWTSGGFTQADFYSIRLLVDNTTVTNESQTTVYFEPDLYSTNWPRWLDQGPGNNSVVPVRDASGRVRLALQNPIYLDTVLPSRLWVFEVDGSSFTTNPLFYGGYAQPAAADLDGAPGDEIVAAEGLDVRVFQSDLSSYPLPSSHNANFEGALVTLADLDGDGRPEIVALGTDLTSSNGWLFAWKADGQLFSSNYPVLIPDANSTMRSDGLNRVVPLDLNGDGLPELLVIAGDSDSTFSVRMFHGDGTPYSYNNWPTILIHGSFQQVAVGDLDGDGLPEIALAYQDPVGANWIETYSATGMPRPGWPRQLAGGTPSRVLLADLDRDGVDEVIAVAFSDLYVFRANGSNYPGAWPIQGTGFQPLSMPVVADIDGDGFPEIVAVQGNTVFASPLYSDPMLVAFRGDGTLARSWHLLGANGNQPEGNGPPIVGDFDGTGKVDVAVCQQLVSGGGIDGSLQEGVLTVFRLGAPYRPDHRDWPMNFHDPRNSSASFIPARLRMLKSGTNVVLSWPRQPDAALVQYEDDLKSGIWSSLSNSVVVSNGMNSVAVNTTNSHRWYRLQYP